MIFFFFPSQTVTSNIHWLERGIHYQWLMLTSWAIWPLAHLELSFFLFSSSNKWHRRCCRSNKHLNFFPPSVFKTILQNAWSHSERLTLKGPFTQETPTSVYAVIQNHHQPLCNPLGKWRYRTACFQPLHLLFLSWEVWIFFPFPGATDDSCPG